MSACPGGWNAIPARLKRLNLDPTNHFAPFLTSALPFDWFRRRGMMLRDQLGHLCGPKSQDAGNWWSCLLPASGCPALLYTSTLHSRPESTDLFDIALPALQGLCFTAASLCLSSLARNL